MQLIGLTRSPKLWFMTPRTIFIHSYLVQVREDTNQGGEIRRIQFTDPKIALRLNTVLSKFIIGLITLFIPPIFQIQQVLAYDQKDKFH